MSVRTFLRSNAWPLGLATVISLFVLANAVLVYAATRDKAIGPEQDYYEQALRHDQTVDMLRRAEQLGLRAAIEVSKSPIVDMPRRLDVRVTDAQGAPVPGLVGTMTAIRPSDVRLRNSATLVSVPEQPGLYRLLLRIPVSGLWEFQIDAKRGTEPLLMVIRQDVSI